MFPFFFPIIKKKENQKKKKKNSLFKRTDQIRNVLENGATLENRNGTPGEMSSADGKTKIARHRETRRRFARDL